MDEYYEAAGLDPRRLDHLRREILALTSATGIGVDAGLTGDEASDLARLDAYLCELKEAQIRDGLHVVGQSPVGRLERDLDRRPPARAARGRGGRRRLADARAGGRPRPAARPPRLRHGRPLGRPAPRGARPLTPDPWRSHGDTVERLERLALACLDGAPPPGPASAAVLAHARGSRAPRRRRLRAGRDGRAS